ncbi:MAG: hypothetical protein KDD69_18975 [Bdellovibrionales bacterium]|nr:hypothetical protein [Bdellovibrionales bacterium]
MPKIHEIGPFTFLNPVNFGKPIDQGTDFSAKCIEMNPILPFLPQNLLEPGPKGGERTKVMKNRFPSRSRSNSPVWPFAFTFVALFIFLKASFADPAVVRIPGTIKKDYISYASKLELDPSEAIVTPKTVVYEDKKVTRFGVELAKQQWTGNKNATAWKELENPSAVLGLYAPIPLEVELTETKGDRTLASRIIPNSVASWNRLKGWDDLQKAVPADQVAKIDQSAADLEKKTQEIILSGTVGLADLESLQKNYETLSRHLGEAFDQTDDFDIQRQISTTIQGVRSERVAWNLSSEISMPVVNPRLRDDLPKPDDQSTKPDSDEAGEQQPQQQNQRIQKAVGYDAPVRYENYLHQEPRSALYYKTVYELGRSTVAICDQNSIPFATGTIIGRDLVLTCAHAVARPGRGGTPAQRGPDGLEVKVGYYAPDDLVTPPRNLPAKLVFEGGFDPSRKDSDQLDFALLKIDGLENYSRDEFANAEALRLVHRNEIKENPNAALLRNPKAYFTPFTWVCLGNFEVSEDTKFFISGHPAGLPKAVSDWGSVLYPRILTSDEKDDMRRAIPSQFLDPASRARTLQLFDDMYRDTKSPSGQLIFRYTYANNSPGIGVLCATTGGNSGSAAIVVSKSEAYIIGILVDGQIGNPKPLKPSIETHEQLLPIIDIIKHLDDNFKRELDSDENFKRDWREEYGVTILKKYKNQITKETKQ